DAQGSSFGQCDGFTNAPQCRASERATAHKMVCFDANILHSEHERAFERRGSFTEPILRRSSVAGVEIDLDQREQFVIVLQMKSLLGPVSLRFLHLTSCLRGIV